MNDEFLRAPMGNIRKSVALRRRKSLRRCLWKNHTRIRPFITSSLIIHHSPRNLLTDPLTKDIFR